jgi:hypothetical protein
MSQRRTRATRGTSFMDVLVGIAITTVTLGIALPQLPAIMEPYRVSTAARVVAAKLSVSRTKAIAQNVRHRVNFDPTAGTFVVERESPPGTWTATEGTHQLPESVSLGDVPIDPVFDTRGMLAQDLAFQLSGESSSQVVSVNVLGNVDIHDPEPYGNDAN